MLQVIKTFPVLSKSQWFTFVLYLLFANALWQRALQSYSDLGPLASVSNTFGISVIVWYACFFATSLSHSISGPASELDKRISILMIFICTLPVGYVAWPALSLFSMYLIASTPVGGDVQRRCGWVSLAVTVPMFWGRLMFNLFSDVFLSIDASLVAQITGTVRTDNLVAMPGGSGFLQIAAPCSSMANVSLAILCWVIFSQYNSLKWKASNIAWAAAACLSVVAINVTRISLIGYFPEYYEVLHGVWGNTVASWLTLISSGLICYYGSRVRHERKII